MRAHVYVCVRKRNRELNGRNGQMGGEIGKITSYGHIPAKMAIRVKLGYL